MAVKSVNSNVEKLETTEFTSETVGPKTSNNEYFGDLEEVTQIPVKDTESSGSGIEEVLDDDVLELPLVVRDVVPLEDDPSTPVVTFRVIILSVIFIIPGAFISVMNSYRTTSAAYSIIFVQIASHWVGKWLARVLPNKSVGFGKYKFDLNPGPWSIKETVLVTISAASGATGSQGTTPLSLAEIYYDETANPAIAIFYMWAIVFTGYSYAAIARNFLLYDPQFIWPQALMQTTLFQSQKKSDSDSKLGSKQMKIFFSCLIGMTVWQFFPEYIFPFTSSLAFLCWVAPRNKTANFIGSGLGGMGFLNLSLDWSNITSNIMIYPYWVQLIQFAAFVCGAWILIPAAKWGNLTSFKDGLMSNSLFLMNGTRYPTDLLLTPDLRLNETAYEELGPVLLGTQRLWNMFFDYASYVSGVCWLFIFGYDQIIDSAKKFMERYRNKSARNVNQFYTDRLNKLQSVYDEVPIWWYLVLFLVSFVILITIFATGNMYMPWWTYIIGIVFGAVIVTPMAWLYALSNFQLAIGTFNELLYGYMVQNMASRHPAGATSYGAVAGDAWYRAQYMLQDQKIGHYMHIPPKAVFFSQVFGEIIGVPINYAALRWILSSKKDYLNGSKIDPLHQWTGQSIVSYQSNAIQYVVLGPSRLFAKYPALPYGFLLGLVAPLVLLALHRLFPRARFNLWNTTIFFSAMSNFYGNLSTGYFSQIIGGTVTMFWAYRYKHELWKKYNYIIAAAFDTGYNLAVLLMFLFFSAGKIVEMPNWWGNNAESVERCFALE